MTPNKQPEANTPDTEWQRTFLNAGTEKGLGDLSMMISVVSELLTSRDTYWKERVELVRNENIECVADNAEDYIRKEKGGNPLPTVEESAVRGFVQYLRENTTTPLPVKII